MVRFCNKTCGYLHLFLFVRRVEDLFRCFFLFLSFANWFHSELIFILLYFLGHFLIDDLFGQNLKFILQLSILQHFIYYAWFLFSAHDSLPYSRIFVLKKLVFKHKFLVTWVLQLDLPYIHNSFKISVGFSAIFISS